MRCYPWSSYTFPRLTSTPRQYPDTPFVIQSKPPIVILPITILDEIRNLPENQVSFRELIAQTFMAKHTGIGKDRPEALKAVKVDLTRHIASTLDGLQDEIRYAFNKELGPCEDWTPVVLYGALARIVALLSGRVFVGRPLSRSEEWIDASINYTMDCVKAQRAIAKWPVYQRYIVAPFLPEIRRVQQYASRGAKLLGPILKATLARAHNEKVSLDDDEGQGTFISWVLKHTAVKERKDPKNLAATQMGCKFLSLGLVILVA